MWPTIAPHEYPSTGPVTPSRDLPAFLGSRAAHLPFSRQPLALKADQKETDMNPSAGSQHTGQLTGGAHWFGSVRFCDPSGDPSTPLRRLFASNPDPKKGPTRLPLRRSTAIWASHRWSTPPGPCWPSWQQSGTPKTPPACSGLPRTWYPRSRGRATGPRSTSRGYSTATA